MQSIHEPVAGALGGAPVEPTSVYRYYDRNGLLIYVGITKQGIGRNRQHERNAEWWRFVTRQEVEHYPTRLAAARRERDLIFANRPPFNKQHNGSHEEMRAAYLRLMDIPIPVESPAQQYSRLDRCIPLDVLRRNDRELVLRTHIEHEPLAGILKDGWCRVPVNIWETGVRCGRMRRVDVIGAVAYLTCEPFDAMPDAISMGRARLKFNTKPLEARIMRLHVVDAARAGGRMM